MARGVARFFRTICPSKDGSNLRPTVPNDRTQQRILSHADCRSHSRLRRTDARRLHICLEDLQIHYALETIERYLAQQSRAAGRPSWDRFAVVTRSATMQVRALDYIAAARAIGASTARIIAAEILPNIANALVVVATLEMAQAILLEATLSFLGLGVPPPAPSWGLMVAEGKEYMFFSPWVITIPGVALFTLVLAINLLGDGLRDLTAPENRA